MLERFTSYKQTNDSLGILKSDSLGWWKRHVSVKGDRMIVNRGGDTIIYKRLFTNEPHTAKKFDKIVLATGSSWGDLVSTIIYPNDKILIYLRPYGGVRSDKFFIQHTPGLFARLTESVYWLSRIERHEGYDQFHEKFRDGVMMDGGYCELLMVAKDSALLKERSQLGVFSNHLLGLSSYAQSKILKKNYQVFYQMMPTISFDSVRATIPICRIEGILNHVSIVTLFMEAIQKRNKSEDDRAELNICFKNTCGPENVHQFCTNGRILSVDYFDRYDVGYDLIDILQYH
jgi:hypothetical protein